MEKQHIALATSRMALGFIFFWAFIDKLFGLGYSTCRDKTTGVVTYMCKSAWVGGGSPTAGFLGRADGTFSWMFKPMATNAVLSPIVSVLFMLALLGIGLALFLGIGMRVAAWSGSILLVAMWFAEVGGASFTTTNPFVDDHIIYATLLFVLYLCNAGASFSLGTWWKERSVVKKYLWLA